MENDSTEKDCCEDCFKWGVIYGEYKKPCNDPACSCHERDEDFEVQLPKNKKNL